MSVKIVDFAKSIDASDNSVIQTLESALEKAKAGGVINCMVVMATDDNLVLDCWANGVSPFVMVGALESLKCDFMRSCMEYR
jgi:hypothetical protein